MSGENFLDAVMERAQQLMASPIPEREAALAHLREENQRLTMTLGVSAEHARRLSDDMDVAVRAVLALSGGAGEPSTLQ